MNDDRRPGHMIWLVRHGESTWNESSLVQGQAAGPVLTATGREQSKSLARSVAGFPINRIVSSDLARAVETASIIAQKLHLVWEVVPALRERDFGVAQGLPLSALRTEWSGVAGERVVDADARPPEGESLRAMSERVGAFFSDLAGQDHDGDVLVVTHGGVIRMAFAHCNRVPVAQMSWGPVPNAGLWSLNPGEICPPVLL